MQGSRLTYVLFVAREPEKYTEFDIVKRSGGVRTICAPPARLKGLQRKLADLLQDCASEIEETRGSDFACHGFKRGRSIMTNARQHRNQRFVFNIDLENFFGSINFGRVRGFFIKDRDFRLHEAVATVIAQIACYRNALPQGSPCSPVIANLIGHVLDVHLVNLARQAGCMYTRYADDLTFSTSKRAFPAAIASPLEGKEGLEEWVPSDWVRRVVTRSGFEINEAKTSMVYRTARQRVTGLVVNARVNVASDYRRTVRAMVHRLTTSGEYHLPAQPGATREGNANELHGRLGFIDTVDAAARELQPQEKQTPLSDTVYRRFLLYTLFHAARMPVVMCEGATDNVYLTHAIRSLASEFPYLAKTEGGRVMLRVRLFKYPRTSTARVLQLHDGGTSNLKKFIGEYGSATAGFAPVAVSHPVIIVFDADVGAKPILSAIKSVAKRELPPEGWLRVTGNLYAVQIPRLTDGPPAAIEDLFPPAVLQTPLGGKTFSRHNRATDPEKHYGKVVFAHKVVRPNASNIDWSGFRPLLDVLSLIIDHHGKG